MRLYKGVAGIAVLYKGGSRAGITCFKSYFRNLGDYILNSFTQTDTACIPARPPQLPLMNYEFLNAGTFPTLNLYEIHPLFQARNVKCNSAIFQSGLLLLLVDPAPEGIEYGDAYRGIRLRI